jgi:hypothetical protein
MPPDSGLLFIPNRGPQRPETSSARSRATPWIWPAATRPTLKGRNLSGEIDPFGVAQGCWRQVGS